MANTRAFALFFAVLLTTQQIAAVSVWSGVTAVIAGYFFGQVTYHAYCWFDEFATFLLSLPSLNNIPEWLMNHPPYFIFEYIYIAKVWMSPEKASILKEYSKKLIICGDNTVCNKAWKWAVSTWSN